MLFMKVDEPVEVRRNLLESAKITIHSLQRYERFKKVREEKAEKIIALRNVMKEIEQLFIQLKRELPDTEIHTPERVEHHGKKVVKTKGKVRMPEYSSELEQLEKELKQIEAKLNALS